MRYLWPTAENLSRRDEEVVGLEGHEGKVTNCPNDEFFRRTERREHEPRAP
jgi:hypothetical protein